MWSKFLYFIVAPTIVFAGVYNQARTDFWGQIGLRYQAQNENWRKSANRDYSFADKENNQLSITTVLGLRKDLNFGFGFGVEVAGWSDLGFQLANNPSVESKDQSDSEVSQAYIKYKYNNSAIKAGRQALPKAVSPWLWSDRNAGVIDYSYEGLVAVNTDFDNTILIAAWIKNLALDNSKINISDNGLFAFGFINKTFDNTTINMIGYYSPDSLIVNSTIPKDYSILRAPINTKNDIYSIWTTINKKFNNLDIGVQAVFVDGNAKDILGDFKTTYALAIKVGKNWLYRNLYTDLTGWFINSGGYSLKSVGSGFGTSAFWGNSFNGEFNGESIGYDRVGARLDFSFKLFDGKLFGGLGYEDLKGKSNTAELNNQIAGRIGFSKKIMGIDTSIQYKYLNTNTMNGKNELTKERVRIEAYYKF